MNIDLDIYTEIQTKLKLSSDSVISENIEWFNNEAQNRDQIVYSYFGREVFNKLVNILANKIKSHISKIESIQILDTGIGTGTFALPIFTKLYDTHQKNINYYGLDISLKMLQVLNNKTNNIFPIIGRLEDIKESIALFRKKITDPVLPQKFDIILATLVIHHIPNLEKMFHSITEVLKENGTLIILDMLEHDPDPEEPEAHPGFNLEKLELLSSNFFKTVTLQPLEGTVCSSKNYSADLFLGEFKR